MVNDDVAKKPFVSVIIPTWRDQKILSECLGGLAKQDYPRNRYEIILVSADKLEVTELGVKIVYVPQNTNPAGARNIGVAAARGEILAFVDDDCIIPPDWISKAVCCLQEKNAALVGGPAVPPDNRPFSYRLAGYLLGAPFVTGSINGRYRAAKKTGEADDYNLILANNFVRKDAFLAISGFDVDQLPCEDYGLYSRLKKAGYKLIYAPEIAVRHHVKPLFFPFINKIFYFANGRSLLMLRHPETARLLYLIPSIFTLALAVVIPLGFFSIKFLYLLAGILSIYAVWILICAFYIFLKFEKNPLVFLYSPPAIFLAHLSYGLGFLHGIYKYLIGDYKGGIKSGGKYRQDSEIHRD
ncbi:MAG: hypothetical protein A2667_03360 [Candidatus Wildermuthbacteria bacterium RIFCSPHIGHO2_01_FULL_47_27]|uniref:Glycosyltransferase 2-like domain-containing protein n=1 Tax=Candidatus Wildermuthbacteria bacterium RIFCSPHIGHO2_02_FULL_47_17 TaxID=1802452 RepID=A0A1G2R2E5_9BACT|nr:MAG: hypothetical protein A2667_03360 [Candidatus Wildermuthbacteria bacterium RIFCSPHIGHO2_01_FULL_47_27]OHA67054.1 MAG: hypothetical protein A3D59_02285 [Candidatus Wildermuthbacteria bacterium RIFCSPHIGHO2_02_FULL_47_17]